MTRKRNYKKECSCGKLIPYSSEKCADCYHLLRRKVKDRPSKESLIQMYDSGMSYARIGKDFGVSDQTIMNWIKNS